VSPSRRAYAPGKTARACIDETIASLAEWYLIRFGTEAPREWIEGQRAMLAKNVEAMDNRLRAAGWIVRPD
jgi:hypothetical protein